MIYFWSKWHDYYPKTVCWLVILLTKKLVSWPDFFLYKYKIQILPPTKHSFLTTTLVGPCLFMMKNRFIIPSFILHLLICKINLCLSLIYLSYFNNAICSFLLVSDTHSDYPMIQ